MSRTLAPSIAPQAGRVRELDGLRAIAISMVLLGHGEESFPAFWGPLRNLLADRGKASLGVTLFFALSGYLITCLVTSERERRGRVCLRSFYLRRTFRILPAFYVYLSVIALLAGAGFLSIDARELAIAASFTWNYLGRGSWWVGHSWSLAVEEQFYLLWPLVLVNLPKGQARRVAAALVLCAPLVRLSTYALFPALRGSIGVMTHTRIDAVLVGCWLALIRDDVARNERIASWTRGLRIVPLTLMLLINAWASNVTGKWALPIGFSLEALGAALVLHWTLHSAPASALSVLRSFPVQGLGRVSYGVYLWQQLFLCHSTALAAVPFPVNAALAIAAGTLSYWAIETPAFALREWFLRRPQATESSAALETPHVEPTPRDLVLGGDADPADDLV